MHKRLPAPLAGDRLEVRIDARPDDESRLARLRGVGARWSGVRLPGDLTGTVRLMGPDTPGSDATISARCLTRRVYISSECVIIAA